MLIAQDMQKTISGFTEKRNRHPAAAIVLSARKARCKKMGRMSAGPLALRSAPQHEKKSYFSPSATSASCVSTMLTGFPLNKRQK